MRLAEPIAVTGATGFIGRRLVRRLLDEGYAPRALVLEGEAPPADWAGVEIVRGDVSRAADARRALEGARTLVHLAAKVGDWGGEEEHRRITAVGTENVLGAAAEQGTRSVLVSSIVVYGDAIGREVCDEDRPFGRALGPYSRNKQEQERIGRRLAARGLPLTIVRPANVFGPGSVPWVDLVLAELRARHPVLIGDGQLNAGLTYVDNVVDVLVRAAGEPAAIGRTYNAGDGSDLTWARYFTDLARIGGAARPRSIPAAVAQVAARVYEASYRLLRKSSRPPITREALNLVGSHHRIPIERARAELGYVPKVDYEAALRQIEEYVSTGGASGRR